MEFTTFEINQPIYVPCQIEPAEITFWDVGGEEGAYEATGPGQEVMVGYLCPDCQEKRIHNPAWTGCGRRHVSGYIRIRRGVSVLWFTPAEK